MGQKMSLSSYSWQSARRTRSRQFIKASEGGFDRIPSNPLLPIYGPEASYIMLVIIAVNAQCNCMQNSLLGIYF